MDEETLIARSIVRNPRRLWPEDAQLVGSDLAVWQIIRDLKAAKGDVLAVATATGLPRELVLAVRTFYLRHPEPIDARIQREQAAPRMARQAT